jgi:hypothetical protein
MSTSTYDTILKHVTDADFRTWGAAWKAALTAIGLTNTTDTGQIDWTTVTIPLATGTYAGYEVWRFNDTLQATKPIFIRFDYGTGNNIDAPQINCQIGTGSDGSGNLTGLLSTTPNPILQGATPVSAVTPYASYFCYSTVVGALCIAFKLGGAGLHVPGYGFVCIGRSCSSVGAPTNSGVTIYSYGLSNGQPGIAQSISFGDAAVYAQHSNYAIVVGNVLGSAVGSNIQVYLNWAHYPRVEPVNWICTAITDEVGRVTLLTPLVGSTSHTYLGLGENSPWASPGSNQSHYSFAMLYE